MIDLRDPNNARYEWSFDTVYTQLAPTRQARIEIAAPDKMSACGYNWIANMKVGATGNLRLPY